MDSRGVFIRYRIDRHDRSQLELKLDYPLREGQVRQEYQVKTFVFVPRVLDVTRTSYAKERFYSESVAFLRITTPRRSLTELAGKKGVKVWAGDLKREIAAYVGGKVEELEIAETNLKLLGCVFKGALRDARLELLQQLEGEDSPESKSEAVAGFLEEVIGARRRLSKIGKRVVGAELPDEVLHTWLAVDEYTSLLAEEALTQVLVSLDETSNELQASVLENMRKAAVAEYQHRRDQGFMTYASEVSDNEYLADRWRVLKRFVNGVLYAKVDRQDVGTLYVDLAGMIAAACAMLVATLCLLFINSRWASNLSWAFVSAMVLSYVLKDRVKEWGRRNLGKRLSRSLADHQLRIRSASTDSLLGSCKETFSIQSIDDLPDEVSAMRCSDLATFDAVQGRPETVLCHTKEISLSSEALRAEFPDANGITDILRLNVSSFLSRMDDVWESYSYVHPESGELRTTRCARVYNLNIVLWMSDAQGKASLRRCRAVLNKKGLIRVETLSEKGDWTGGEVLVGRAFEDAALVVLGEDDA